MSEVPNCPACGQPMTDILAGVIACAPGGKQVDVGSAYQCTDRTCQEQRDEAAIARMIDPEWLVKEAGKRVCNVCLVDEAEHLPIPEVATT